MNSEDIIDDQSINPNEDDEYVVNSVGNIFDEENSQDNEIEFLDDDLEDILGTDPTRSKCVEFDIHHSLLNRWKVWTTEGFQKSEIQELMEKYKVCEFLQTPQMNPEIVNTMNDAAIKKDKYLGELQDFIGTALSCLGGVISKLLDNKEEKEPDVVELVRLLADVGKLLSIAHFKQLAARKAFVTPALDKKIKTVLENTKPDKFVFGKDLGEKIKDSRSLNRLSQGLKFQPTLKRLTPSSSRHHLNWRDPPSARQSTWQAGFKQNFRSTNFQSHNNSNRFQRHQFKKPLSKLVNKKV